MIGWNMFESERVVMDNMERLTPAIVKARDWKIGQCVAKLSEEYAELLTANKAHIKAIKGKAAGPDGMRDYKEAYHNLIEECVDLMTAARTLLWKLGLSEGDFRKVVHDVNLKNKVRGYF